MKKDLCVFALLTAFIFAFWYRAMLNFFAQDDFILINQFSQNNLLQDIQNVFGFPQVTHWRPIHNLYFFVTGNIFGKNYFGYHILTFLFHIGASFLVYKTASKLTNSSKAGFVAGFIYAIHPAHFISLFWISGGTTLIGFFFLAASFYSHLLGKRSVSLILYVLALLASEAMIVGLIIFAVYEFLFKREKIDKLFLTIAGIISVIFLIIRFDFFTSKTTFNVYQIELSTKTISAVKYYLLRIAGFAEVSGDQLTSLILLGWLALIALLLIKTLNKERGIRQLILSITIIIIGLFPFILIPKHLSPHYMNISIFGFSILVGVALINIKSITRIILLSIFLIITLFNINLTQKNNWVIKRSNLAKIYIDQIKKVNPPQEATLVFTDNKLSTSKEAYIALGTGYAIKFFFSNKNYQTCFSEFEDCLTNNANIYVIGD
ncbi:hypothetical protein A2164_03145 [Candidatus Curtissbacteria bacterium RBG_13_35_7]|uniref:Glycosyltransferase RgtA/B/C/D-like domain-containing protein n=1 Tax=Candidatus Curtissbacteria bacterium RBG_13_35_7 TaxID=1797705 RepID=A0A1F5G5F4_9BACT|nr:MAG: hypothetical protein A2164_03145 [Candidatus Curtissbacteria bacterium RBG_13_35_7]